jgi:two-component system, chemotaxis family, sensor histidine kinase and response regulator PixL
MITSDQEQQVKLQFLEEATDYLDAIESGLLGLGAGAVTDKQLDALLRAAHSIKGGAAMMGFTTLASLGHHLEDYFKIIQYGRADKPDAQVEQLLLGTIDCLRQIVAFNRQGRDADEAWLAERVNPLFDRLRDRLGEFNPEDEANMLASESGEDIHAFIFETEVERCLTDLETLLASGESTNSLYDELVVGAEELCGLAQMLELAPLASLCESVLAHLTTQPHQTRAIAALALTAWRRTQAMVLIGQIANLPIEIELPGSGIMTMAEANAVPAWSQSDLDRNDAAATFNQRDASDFVLVGDVDLYEPHPTISDLSDEEFNHDYAPFGENVSANDFAAFDDPFADIGATVPQSFSTITASDDLEALSTIADDRDEVDEIHFQTTIANEIHFQTTIADEGGETLSTIDSIHLHTTVAPTEEGEIINAFDRLDLSGDLSLDLDTDASELLSDLSGFLSGPEDGSSAIFKVNPKTKAEDYLAKEAADLLTALDAAPEVPGESLAPHEQANVERPQAGTPVADQTIRVATKQLEQIGDLFGELTIDRNGLNLHLQGLRQLVTGLHLKVQQLEQSNSRLRAVYDSTAGEGRQSLPETETWEQTHNTLSQEFTSQLDLLEFDRYSETHLLSQEVMDTIVQIEEIATDLDLQLNDTERTTRDLNRTAKQLQTGLTQVRMRPISELFNRFPRAIRNLSVQHAKPIDLKLRGGDTPIERSTLEALNDPLMHLLRNAFDHGIEPSATRRANGKSDTGAIEIAASYRGNQIVITIKDDGGGIDLDKIRAKVRKMGIGETEIAKFKDSELIDLIFEPGFSTADKLTDLSGRGVGMDVVRTNIRSLNGDIYVDTELGKGSTFTINVPFALSVIRVLIVEVNGLWLAIPSNIIEEIILLDPTQIINTAGQKLLQWADLTMHLIEPARYLDLSHTSPQITPNTQPTIDCPTVLTIDRGQDIVAFQIDKFWGEQEVTIRQPQGNIKMPPGFTGCTILGDGRIVPLVDAIEFIRWIDGDLATSNTMSTTFASTATEAPLAEQPSGTILPKSTTPAAPAQRSRILVVDDSINVRRFVALTLEKAGYLVEQAKDGQEAVEKLQTGLSVQAVVCDIEMPRMDGYGFLATVKGQSQFKHIPVLMLTSRSGEKHRKIAMNLGANGYFSKPFKEQELLATLTQFLEK